MIYHAHIIREEGKAPHLVMLRIDGLPVFGVDDDADGSLAKLCDEFDRRLAGDIEVREQIGYRETVVRVLGPGGGD